MRSEIGVFWGCWCQVGGRPVLMIRQVESRDYNPPKRERILNWQAQQAFPILPNPKDPDCGNVYRNLKFPEAVYEHIGEYQEEKIEAGNRRSQMPLELQ